MSLCPACLALWASMPPTLPESGCQGLSLAGILNISGHRSLPSEGWEGERKIPEPPVLLTQGSPLTFSLKDGDKREKKRSWH